MQFKDIIGQQEVNRHLVEMLQDNRLPHALLFLGKEGNGSLPIAIAFAQYVVCEKVSGNAIDLSSNSLFYEEPQLLQKKLLQDSCGICASCIKANQLIHPDIHFSYPTIKKSSRGDEKPISTDFIVQWRDFIKTSIYGNDKDWIEYIKQHPHDKIENPTNKQGNITAEECNDIIRKLSLKPFESEYKVLILWTPELLSNQGNGNKLLKLIEEPPANTLFILVATDESLILPTIVSRTQLIKIPALETRDIENALIERAKLSYEQARQIASVSEGNYREALQLMLHAEEDWQSILRDWLNATLKTGPVAQVKWVDEISKLGRERQKQFLRYFNHLLEQAIRLRVVGGDANISIGGDANNSTDSRLAPVAIGGDWQLASIPGNEKDFALRLNKITSLSQQTAIIGEIDKATYYIERNAHAKMLFQALTIKLYHIIVEQTIPTAH